MRFSLCIVLAGLVAQTVFAQIKGNLIADSSFEKGGLEGPFSTNWVTFGQVYCEPDNPRSGIFAAKIYGNFTGQANLSGLYQDQPAQPGRFYEATGYFKQISKDHLKGDNVGRLKLEFLDQDWNRLATYESMASLDDKSPANKFVFLSTGRAPSPPRTVRARIVAIFSQGAEQAHGAIWVDDLSLREIQ